MNNNSEIERFCFESLLTEPNSLKKNKQLEQIKKEMEINERILKLLKKADVDSEIVIKDLKVSSKKLDKENEQEENKLKKLHHKNMSKMRTEKEKMLLIKNYWVDMKNTNQAEIHMSNFDIHGNLETLNIQKILKDIGIEIKNLVETYLEFQITNVLYQVGVESWNQMVEVSRVYDEKFVGLFKVTNKRIEHFRSITKNYHPKHIYQSLKEKEKFIGPIVDKFKDSLEEALEEEPDFLDDFTDFTDKLCEWFWNALIAENELVLLVPPDRDEEKGIATFDPRTMLNVSDEEEEKVCVVFPGVKLKNGQVLMKMICFGESVFDQF
ncbi:hypothetical protein M0813_01726 [Anaeramoeba flamelloides]|uniref:Uncharacterized protein n=1 Tax=Anaeramoeba flamelloides TaxID=1746091 RepID=A0ABQ8YWZ5_9EUKA|nr:hypothetical protein M0813_01726 [Anaeramoeba flamelloides]